MSKIDLNDLNEWWHVAMTSTNEIQRRSAQSKILSKVPSILDALEEAHKIIDPLDPKHCEAWINRDAAEAAVSWLARFTDEETK